MIALVLDEPAFVALYIDHYLTMVRFFLRRLRYIDPDDFVSETFLRAWAHRQQYSDQGKPLAWLFTIARNVLTDYVRTLRDRPVISLGLAFPFDIPVLDSAYEQAEGRLDAAKLVSVISANHVKVLVLAANGATGKEAAEHLRLSENATRQLKLRAQMSARKALAKHGLV